MQIQTKKMGMLNTSRKVLRLRGFLGFYDGFSAAAARQMICTSFRFTIYEYGKSLELMNNNLGAKIIVASFAGTVGSFIGIPLDVINVRMQTDMTLKNGEHRKYKSLVDAMIRIPKEEGWKALYSGGTFAIMKAAIGTIGQIAAYDQVKSELQEKFNMEDTITLHFTSSFLSSFIDSIITQPFDVLKTLMMYGRPGEFPTIFAAGKHMMRFGYLGPFRGLLPTIARKAPANVVLYLIYEQLRLHMGYVGFPKRLL